jgi:phosphoesterase RecJ-like protein
MSGITSPHATARTIAEHLLSSKTLLVASHHNPDADAYGSILGLALGLIACGKTVTVYNVDGIRNDYYAFFPGINLVTDTLVLDGIDAVVACDCGDAQRLGDVVSQEIIKHPNVINIDHHASNTQFGALNYVVEDASSTSELILDILEELSKLVGRTLIHRDIATALYAGISADTGSFRYAATKAATFHAAARLVGYGADPASIADALYAQTTPSAIQLQVLALSGMRFLAGGAISVVVVDSAMLESSCATIHDTEDLAEKARSIQGVKISVLIRQDGEIWKVSLRSKSAVYDVSTVARSFGGGGHRCASGLRWRQDRPTLEATLFPQLVSLVSSVQT